jgi:hypothetical protein
LTLVDSEGRERSKATIDLGRVLGVAACVETHEGDEVLWAQRVNRPGLSRFVKNR